MNDRKATQAESTRDGSNHAAEHAAEHGAPRSRAQAAAPDRTPGDAEALKTEGHGVGQPDPHIDAPESEQADDLPPLDEADVLRVERDALQDRLLRLAAEYDNFRKRNAREWQEHRKRAATEVLRDLLEVCDNLERALETPDEDSGGLRKGVELIHQQFQGLFARFGLEGFDEEGQPFDPHRHEAVQMVESDDVASQHVVNVVQRGYTLHGEVLRPARVTVSK